MVVHKSVPDFPRGIAWISLADFDPMLLRENLAKNRKTVKYRQGRMPGFPRLRHQLGIALKKSSLKKEFSIMSIGADVVRKTTLLAIASAAALLAPSCLATSGASMNPSNWPDTRLAQRDFSATAIVTDLNRKPHKLWMISAPHSGAAHAMEFFTGEQADVHADGNAYTFSDASGHHYESRRARPSTVDLTAPTIGAGWEKDGKGHDVIVGARLKDDSVASQYFDGARSCESKPYVISTEASRFQAAEVGFSPVTKIIADFDVKGKCWTSKPLHMVDLEDNTFLFFTQDRVLRVNSLDLTPAGTAPDFRIVHIK